MKYYLIDEIRSSDIGKIEVCLQQDTEATDFDKVFWIKIPDNLLTSEQSNQHKPFVIAIESGNDWVKAELFVRSLENFTGKYQGYCNTAQANFVMEYINNIIQKLNITT